MADVHDKYRGSKGYMLVYCALISAAGSGKTVTYQDLAPIVGLPLSGNYMGRELGLLLGEIVEDEQQNGRPMLTAIVVGSSGLPGAGFFELARQLGKLTQETGGERQFWEAELATVYEFWKPVS